ncbi:DNA primase large subunit-like [Watersipora subatra]|uniref:DNA primase large subunit-like n=1 Tax=Watersipora subatra TaxID=2589382 RepID=UPI00355C0901
MDFKRSSRSLNYDSAHVLDHGQIYGYHSFYKRAPTGSITLQQFEAYAVERLKVLKAIELNSIMKTKYEEFAIKMKGQFNELGWHFLTSGKLNKEDNEKDLISHHILRLAYAKSEAKRQWFVTQEAELLRLRMYHVKNLMDRLLEVNHLRSNVVPENEAQNLVEELKGCQSGLITNPTYYKVAFEEVLQLVSIRKVYLSEGFAYLPSSELTSFVLNKYRIHLKEQMAVACKLLPGLEEENRVMKQLNALSGADLGASYTAKAVGDEITCDMLDELSGHSYPLCMQSLHKHIRSKHHAKHTGRMQYGLFLKGIGVSLEQSLKFWRTEFCKGGMEVDKFDKSYAYGIRHNYGKEGKRADYTPYSCMKIINLPEAQADQCHGCPYKIADDLTVRQMLEKRKISLEAVEEIMTLKKQGHYQIACTSLFKATHPKEGLQDGLRHPNQYFAESQAILHGTSDSTESKAKQELRKPSSHRNTSKQSSLNKENMEFTDEFTDDLE